MTFPVYIPILGARVHPHVAFDLAAYLVGFAAFFLARRPRVSLPAEQRAVLLIACFFGGLLGAKGLAWVESGPAVWTHGSWLPGIIEGKTIVGGLLGAWIGIELAKGFLGVKERTGDAYVFPAIAGIAIGRIGCFFTGLSDGTCGSPTSLRWGVDFGDGVPRHPTQIYEIAFLGVLGATLWCAARWAPPPGALFRMFLLGYLVFRVGVEFLKPTWKPILGLSPIQTASLAGAAICLGQLWSRGPRVAKEDGSHAAIVQG